MNRIEYRVMFFCKYITVVILICICNINIVFCKNVVASELPTIELNTTTEENVEETQEKQKNEENKENEYKIVDYSNYYIVLGSVLIIAAISIILNIILLIDKKKSKEYKKQVDKIKNKYSNNYDKEINVCNNEIKSEAYLKNEKIFSSTSMLWKVVIQLYDKTNNIVYDTSFDSSKENTEIKIGRGDKVMVDIKIPLPNISDQHCIILKRGNKYYLKDLNSTNGTKYNGEKVVDKIELNYQGGLNLGSSKFELNILDSKKRI